jgi:hypothetical protein
MVDGDGWSGVSGRYAAGRDIIASSEESYDEAKAGRLWQVSESLLGEIQTDEISPPGAAIDARGRRGHAGATQAPVRPAS